jgi:hypothetical protein
MDLENPRERMIFVSSRHSVSSRLTPGWREVPYRTGPR